MIEIPKRQPTAAARRVSYQQVNLPIETHNKLKQLARESGHSMAAIVVMLVEQATVANGSGKHRQVERPRARGG